MIRRRTFIAARREHTGWSSDQGSAIDDGKSPPSLVAAMTGFADQSHLTTHFKRYTGITPAHYQRCLSAR